MCQCFLHYQARERRKEREAAPTQAVQSSTISIINQRMQLDNNNPKERIDWQGPNKLGDGKTMMYFAYVLMKLALFVLLVPAVGLCTEV